MLSSLKALVAAFLANFVIVASSHALPIRSDLLGVTYATLTPTSLNIPTSIFCGGSCGFTARPFLLTIGIRSYSSFELEVLAAHASIYEVDVFFDDLAGSFIQTANLPTKIMPGQFSTIYFGMVLDAASLNAQCLSGCDSNAGYAAEGGRLEFAALAQLDFRLHLPRGSYLDFSTPVFPNHVPEPGAFALVMIGLLSAAFALARRARPRHAVVGADRKLTHL